MTAFANLRMDRLLANPRRVVRFKLSGRSGDPMQEGFLVVRKEAVHAPDLPGLNTPERSLVLSCRNLPQTKWTPDPVVVAFLRDAQTEQSRFVGQTEVLK